MFGSAYTIWLASLSSRESRHSKISELFEVIQSHINVWLYVRNPVPSPSAPIRPVYLPPMCLSEILSARSSRSFPKQTSYLKYVADQIRVSIVSRNELSRSFCLL